MIWSIQAVKPVCELVELEDNLGIRFGWEKAFSFSPALPPRTESSRIKRKIWPDFLQHQSPKIFHISSILCSGLNMSAQSWLKFLSAPFQGQLLVARVQVKWASTRQVWPWWGQAAAAPTPPCTTQPSEASMLRTSSTRYQTCTNEGVVGALAGIGASWRSRWEQIFPNLI